MFTVTLIHWNIKAAMRTILKQHIIAIGKNLITTSDVCSGSVQHRLSVYQVIGSGLSPLCQLSLPLHDIKHTLQWNVPGLTHCQTHPDTSLSLASHLMSSFPRQDCYPKPSLETDTHMLPNTQAPTFNHCFQEPFDLSIYHFCQREGVESPKAIDCFHLDKRRFRAAGN